MELGERERERFLWSSWCYPWMGRFVWVNLSKLLNSMMIMTRDDSNKSISQLSSRSIIQVSQLANLLERACPSSPSPKTIEIEKQATLCRRLIQPSNTAGFPSLCLKQAQRHREGGLGLSFTAA